MEPGREHDDRQDVVSEARVIHDALPRGADQILQPEGDAHGLHDADEDGQVACVLDNLLAPLCAAFLLELLDVGPDHAQKLEDDGRGDVRTDAEHHNRKPREPAAGENIQKTEELA